MSDASPSPLDTARRYGVCLLDGRSIELRRMQRWDRHVVTTFLKGLDAQVRPLLPDITDPHDVDSWIADVESGRTTAILASADTRIVAYAGIRRVAAPWMEHVGEVGFAISGGWRSIELAEHLWRELMAAVAAPGLQKLVVMTPHGQADERAIAERLGFSAEGLLADQLIDEAGRRHDLVIMSRRVRRSFVFVPQNSSEASAGAQRLPVENGKALLPEPAPCLVAAAALRPSSSLLPARDPRDLAGGSDIAARPRARGRFVKRTRVVAVVIAVLLTLVGGAFYVNQRSSGARRSQVLGASAASTAPIAPARAVPFGVSRTGSGGVLLPRMSRAMTLEVAVAPEAVGPWFWCLESSFGIPLAEHHCGSDSTARRSEMGELITGAVVHVDRSWPADALYFVDMYCERACRWRLTVAPSDPEVAR